MNVPEELLTEANLHHTNWGERIIKANDSPDGFNSNDRALALDWVTCACGSITQDIERLSSGAPWDGVLFTLGMNFTKEVSNNWPIEAAQTLIEIEKRVMVLIK